MSDHPPSRTRLHCMVSILYAKQLIKHRYALGSLLMAFVRACLCVRTHCLTPSWGVAAFGWWASRNYSGQAGVVRYRVRLARITLGDPVTRSSIVSHGRFY